MTIDLTLRSDSANTYLKEPLTLSVAETGGSKLVSLELQGPMRSVQVDLSELRRALDALSPP